MSVDKVQFNQWLATQPPGVKTHLTEGQQLLLFSRQQKFDEWLSKQPDNVKNMSLEKQQRRFEREVKILDEEAPVLGAEVEKGNDIPLTEEGQAAKDAAKARAAEDVQKQKEAAAKYYRPTEELTETEQSFVDEAVEESGKDKPLYKNQKAKKALKENLQDAYKDIVGTFYDELIEAAETDEAKAALLKDKERALGKKELRKRTKVWAKDIRTGDRIENTIMFDSQKEKRAARKELRKEGETDYRLKVHNKRIKSDNNELLQATKEHKQISGHQAVYEYSKDISGDREFDPNEVKNFGTKSGEGDKLSASRQELRRLGYEVKDDTLINVAKGLGVAVASGIAGSALPSVVTATARAIAQVLDKITGEILAQDVKVETETEQLFNVQGGALGGAVAAVLAGVIFGETKDEDMLNGVSVEEIFKDNENTGKRAYETMDFGNKHGEQVKLVLRAIDSLDATDAQKTELLKQAAGKESQHILSSKELALALLKASYAKEDPSLIPEDPECPPCPDCPEDNNPTNPSDYEVKYTEDTKERTEYTQTGLKHKSGLYADTIVRKGYIREDGQNMTEKQIKEIRDIIQKDNLVNERKKVPNIWILNNEITLSDGTKVKLRPEDELNKIQPEKSEASSIGLYTNTKELEKHTVRFTTHGYQIIEKQPDGSEKVVAEQGNFENEQEAHAAAEKALQDIENADKTE